MQITYTVEFWLFFLQLVKSAFGENQIAPIVQLMIKTDSMCDEGFFALTLSTDEPIQIIKLINTLNP